MSSDAQTSGIGYPVFPLPNFVLFPTVQTPLHIFEPRYRQMIDEALDRDGRFCTATLKPDLDQIDDQPPLFFPLGCTCEIVDYERIQGERYNIVVRGMEIVKIVESTSLQPYRTVTATSLGVDLEDVVSGDAINTIRRLAIKYLSSHGVDATSLDSLFSQMKQCEIVNLVSFILPLSGLQKLPLLTARSNRERAERLSELLAQFLKNA